MGLWVTQNMPNANDSLAIHVSWGNRVRHVCICAGWFDQVVCSVLEIFCISEMQHQVYPTTTRYVHKYVNVERLQPRGIETCDLVALQQTVHQISLQTFATRVLSAICAA